MKERVVITGAAGLIGGLVAADLDPDYDVLKLDRVWRSGLLRRRQDARRVGFLQGQFAGADTVIDLASDAAVGTTWRAVLKGNIPAAVSVFEAARRAGVRRVVYASSSHVTGLYERDEPYASICAGRYEGLDPSTIPPIMTSFPLRPDSPYGAGKAAAEAAARYYAEEHGLSILALRIGTVYPADRPGSARGFATMLSHRDLNGLIRACITADESVRFGIIYGVSANTWRYWDIEEGRRLLGFSPSENAEDRRQT